jgi:hypothetical protein
MAESSPAYPRHLATFLSSASTSRRDWSDAGPIPGDLDWAGGTVFTDRREIEIAASPAEAFAAVEPIGGATGWYGTR